VAVLSATARAATLYVGAGETYTTIQAAVTAANAGDVVVVRDGTYVENVLVDNNVVPGDVNSGLQDRTGLTLQSENGSATTSVEAAATDLATVAIEAHGITFTGFTVRGAGWSQGGIALRGAHNCTISANMLVENFYGIILTRAEQNGPGACSNTITGNTIGSNEQHGMMVVSGSNHNLISGNDIHSLGIEHAGGVLFFSSTHNQVVENTIHDNNMAGVYVDLQSDYTSFLGNDLSYNTGSAIALRESSGLIVARNTFSNNDCGIATYNVQASCFYLNNFISNSPYQVTLDTLSNTAWYSPAPLAYTYNGADYTGQLGNYWDTHTSTDADGNGVLDDPYTVYGEEGPQDLYPLAATHVDFALASVPLVYNADTGQSFATIQGAIDDPTTLDGHNLQVGPAAYAENVLVNKELTIIADTALGTAAVTAVDPAAHVVAVTAANVTIQGLTLSGATNAGFAGIYVAPTASNCTVQANTCSGNDIGILVDAVTAYAIADNAADVNTTCDFRAVDSPGGSVAELFLGAAATTVSFDYSGTIALRGTTTAPAAPPSLRPVARRAEVVELGMGSQLTLTLHYSQADVRLVNEASLALYRWNGSAWAATANGGLNIAENKVYASIDGPGIVAPFGIHQVTAVWRNPDVGVWDCGTCWSTINWPNNNGVQHYSAHIDAGSVGDVVVSLGPSLQVYIDNLTVDAGDTLDIDTAALVIDSGPLAGTIDNNGTIKLTSAGSGTYLRINRDVLLTGYGELVLHPEGPNYVYGMSPGYRLTNATGHTIRGSRRLGNNYMALTNQGLIDADNPAFALEVDPTDTQTVYNTGIMQSSNGATLWLANGTVDNTDGVIQALDGSVTQIANTTVSHGELTTAGTGVVELRDNGMIVDLTNSGRLQVPIGGGNGYLSGTITNNALIEMVSVHFGTALYVYGDVTLQGNGALDLWPAGPNYVRGSSASNRLTNGTQHTIRGSRNFGNNDLCVTNLGLIDADDAGDTLVVNLTDGAVQENHAVMQASGGGTLRLYTASYDNSDGVIQALDGSIVQIAGAVVAGGELTSSGSGLIELREGGLVADLTNTGVIRVPNGGSPGYLQGTVLNEGTIELASTGNGTTLYMYGNVTLEGSGDLDILPSGPNYVRGNASTDRLTNGPDHTIHGARELGYNALAVSNAGLIDADRGGSTLVVNPADAVTNYNTGVMQSSGGGILQLTGGSFDNTGGVIQALDGSTTQIAGGAAVTGGELRSFAGGMIHLSSSGRLVNLTSDAYVRIPNGQGPGYLQGTIVNNGTLEVQGGGSGTAMYISGNVLVSGTGTLLIGGHNDIYNAACTLTNGADHTIRTLSNNDIQPTLVNEGIVDVPTGTSLLCTTAYSGAAGSTTLVNGTLTAPGTTPMAGVLAGSGTFSGSVTLAAGGTLSPGNSAGRLTISGSCTHDADSSVHIELGGATPITGYDVLRVTSTANLAGELRVTLINGFVPTLGQSFTIVTGGTITGQFGTVTAAGGYNVTYNATNVTITLVAMPGDFDDDDDVDVDDFAVFADCLAGPEVTTPPPGCDPSDFAQADLDGDEDVDLADVASFNLIFTGS